MALALKGSALRTDRSFVSLLVDDASWSGQKAPANRSGQRKAPAREKPPNPAQDEDSTMRLGI
jgi:hypothetical protein